MSLIGIGPHAIGVRGRSRVPTYEDYKRHVLDDRPIAYWPLDDVYSSLRSGGVADASGNGVTAVNTSIAATEVQTGWSARHVGTHQLNRMYSRAVRNQGASFCLNATLAVPSTFSVEGWVMLHNEYGSNIANVSANGYTALMAADNSTGANLAVFFLRSSVGDNTYDTSTFKGNKIPIFSLGRSGGGFFHASSSRRCELFIPQHLVGTCDGINIRLYHNGVLEATTSMAGESVIATAAGAKFSVCGGWYNHANTDYSWGTFSDHAVFNYALPPDRIADRYRLGMGLPRQGAEGYR